MPADFAPGFTEHSRKLGSYIRWASTLRSPSGEALKAELGYSKPKDARQAADRMEALRGEVWMAMEYARLGRLDLLAHLSVDRHRPALRPVSAPQIVLEKKGTEG
jgi:hypothetical protein